MLSRSQILAVVGDTLSTMLGEQCSVRTRPDGVVIFNLSNEFTRSCVAIDEINGETAAIAEAWVAARVGSREAAERWTRERNLDLPGFGTWNVDRDDDVVYRFAVSADAVDEQRIQFLLELLGAAHREFQSIVEAADALHPNHVSAIENLIAEVENA